MTQNLSILIIDDDQVDREAVCRYLKKRGRTIDFHEACGGKDAEPLLREKKFDCVFLDYNMPDTDGISLLRKVYNPETGLAPSPTVMLTGRGGESVMIDALRWGAQDYLIKDDISPDALYIALTKAKEMHELKKSQYQATEILRQAQKMEAVGQMTSGIAHDFNNLLTIILGNARMQRRILNEGGDLKAEGFEKKISAIETAANRGADLVSRLMIFSRQRPLQEETVDINRHVNEIHELLKRTLGERIEIKTAFSQDLWPVRIDTGQFENALINMAVNARDAMPGGGLLTIETRNVSVDEDYVFRNPDMSPGPYVMTAISDTGTGMPPEVMKRIFDPFFTTKKTGEGTGLGLSMVYGMLRQSGGYIHVYSEEGHGTVFRIYLPRYSAEREEPHEGDEGNLTGHETILIVDDDEKIRTVGALMLERLGYKALQAGSARTGLEILKREHQNISLLFTDIHLQGGMGGVDLAQKVREYFPHIKVLFTSGYTEETMPERLPLPGAELIGKPYRKAELARKIRGILDQKETGQ